MVKLKDRINYKILGNDFGVFYLDGIMYFSASEVGEMIGYSKSNISKMVSKVDDDEKTQFVAETKGKHVNSRNRPQWFLTKDGLFEMLFQSRKEMAKEFKKQIKRILKELEKNGYYVATEKDSEWLGVRGNSKENRKKETDEIKKFVKYAEKQGSKSADKYYMHFSNLANKYAGIESNSRDNATQEQLLEVIVAENIIKKQILKLLEKSTPYKQVYQIVKKKIEELK